METPDIAAAKPAILVIEDDLLFAGLLREILERQGYAVTHVADSRLGAGVCATIKPALVVTDILMPELDGIEVIKQLRAQIPCPPVIAITGGGRMDAEIYLGLASQLGASRVLRKPFPAADLTDAITELLAPG